MTAHLQSDPDRSALEQELRTLRLERDLVSAALIVHGADGTLIFSNAAASRLLGLSPDQLAGRARTDPHWRFLRPDGSTMPVEEYPVSRVARSQEPLTGYVLGVVRGQGQKPTWVQCDAHPEFDESGQFHRIVVCAIDVTELRESTGRLNLALQAASMGDWRWELATDSVQLSARAAEILGFSVDVPVTWREIREHLHPDDRERAAAAVAQAMDTRTTYEIEYRVVHDGAERWIAAWGRGTYGHQDQPVGMIGVVQDITARRRTQQEAAAEAELLELLNRTSTLIAGELDLDMLLQGVTDAATKLTGAQFGAFFYNGLDDQGEAYLLYTLSGAPRSAFESFGHPRPTALFGPTFHGTPAIRIDDVRADPRYGQWGPHHGMPKGHLPVRSYLAVSVVSRRGEVIGGLFFGHPKPGVFTERSERLAMGIAAQASAAIDNARLYAEAQRATRQRDLLLESERRARQDAESASRLKDQFLATLSHELRTPLSAILGWLHILRRKGIEDAAVLDKGLDVIERSARSQHQLIEDMLDMSRIVSGKLHLNLAIVDAAQVVATSIDLIAPSAEAAGVALISRADDEPLPVRADAARLQQVIWNLLNNSTKFTPAGGRIEVSTAREGDKVRIVVKDTGIGIKSEFLPHLFDRFRQGDQSTTRRFGGLGLGLTLVDQLARLHGGSVSVHSAGENRGATFSVTLPLADASQDSAGPTDDRAVVDQLHGTVLVVEDDEATREFLVRLLRDAGAITHFAANAADARAFLSGSEPIDLLISDIGMPGEDGYQLIRWLRGLAAPRGSVPAIALTAFARREDASAALDAGFDAHLPKPVDIAEFMQKAAGLLQRAEDRASG